MMMDFLRLFLIGRELNRHRTRRSKGCLSRNGMLHMMFKLGQCAEKKWRRLRGFDYLTKVMIGVKFEDGVEVTEIDLVAA